MKKLFGIIAASVLCIASAAAEVNVSLNACSGPVLSGGGIELLYFTETGITADYAFPLDNGDSISAGIDLAPLLLPFGGITASYNKCITKDKSKDHKWFVQFGLTAGACAYGNDYTDENMEVHNSWTVFPAGKLEVIFARKPEASGFYFGAGPAISFCMPSFSSSDPWQEFSVVPGISLKTGFKF